MGFPQEIKITMKFNGNGNEMELKVACNLQKVVIIDEHALIGKATQVFTHYLPINSVCVDVNHVYVSRDVHMCM